MELTPRHLTITALWIAWCCFHSLMIAPGATGCLKQKLGDRFRFYRLFFNAFALATFLPLAAYSFIIEETPVIAWEGALVIVKYGLLAASIFLFAAGARQYNLSTFLGLDQIRGGRSARGPAARPAFATTGILAVIRHPWYAGGLLFIWARDLGMTALLVNLVFSAYLVAGAFLEERKLFKEFGDDYRRYQNRVSMFFPWKRIRNK